MAIKHTCLPRGIVAQMLWELWSFSVIFIIFSDFHLFQDVDSWDEDPQGYTELESRVCGHFYFFRSSRRAGDVAQW